MAAFARGPAPQLAANAAAPSRTATAYRVVGFAALIMSGRLRPSIAAPRLLDWHGSTARTRRSATRRAFDRHRRNNGTRHVARAPGTRLMPGEHRFPRCRTARRGPRRGRRAGELRLLAPRRRSA